MPEMIAGQTMGISVQAGWYNTRFIGTEEREDMVSTLGKNAGKAMPRMAWVWEVTDGPSALTRAMAKMSPGNAIKASASIMKILSSHPPK